MEGKELTLQEKLERRRIHPVGKARFHAITLLSKALFYKKYGVTFNYNIDLAPYRDKPYVLVSNHASRADYVFTGLAMWPDTFNYVVGYNEFFRGHLSGVLRALSVIPKKNFVPYPYAVKQMARVIKEGGRLIIMPEGMSSISGANQPCALGGGQLLKYLGVPVLYTKIRGGYLTNPKFNMTDRPGKVDVTVDLLFSAEELKSMTAEEIQSAMDVKLWHDDYAWNKKARVKFDGKGRIAENLHQLLFWCPKCGGELVTEDEGSVIRCKACDNEATINEYYDIVPRDENCVFPETLSRWFDMQREYVRRRVSEEGFTLSEHIKLGTLPEHEYLKSSDTSVIVGEGELTLDREGLHYDGTRNGEQFTFFVPTRQLPTYGMCTDVSRFYTFVDGEFMEFYPERDSTELWFMATEELHRLAGGPWHDFTPEQIAARE